MSAVSIQVHSLEWKRPEEREVEVSVPGGALGARLYLPARPRGSVIVAHPSGIARLGRRERFLACSLARAGFATLLVDLLTEEEDEVREGAHVDVPLLAERVLSSTRWLRSCDATARLPLGYFGVGAAGAAALVAAVIEPRGVHAIVSRGSRPDHAGASLLLTRVPSLFMVGGGDEDELAANRLACGLAPDRRLEVIPSASGKLVESEAQDQLAALSTAWFTCFLPRLASSFEAGLPRSVTAVHGLPLLEE